MLFGRGRSPGKTNPKYQPLLEAIARREEALSACTDSELVARATRMRQEPTDDLAEPLALAREACRRGTGMRPFDVQMLGSLALIRGKVAQMATGEGKTLAAVPAAFVLALRGHSVHVLTANDYLAGRDAEWMGGAYRLLGLSVGCIRSPQDLGQRRAAYSSDITYATATEMGFDHLRDRLATTPGEVVQGELQAAIVDEIDSILIDEARIPLVVAGGSSPPPAWAYQAAAVARELIREHDYVVDLDLLRATLTPEGSERLEPLLDRCPVPVPEFAVMVALQAEALVHEGVDYIVRDGRVELVDAFKGRVADLRRWPDGFQSAVEAKEGLELTEEAEILSTMTLQSLFRLYRHRCGMTATAATSATELAEAYGLDVAVVPPNRPCIRWDHPDLVFANRDAKEASLVEEIAAVHATGRPILVGTASVAESERLAGKLEAAGVDCRVLNARHDAVEADIIARAGARGAVTISTNMAGRGTDIRLGGPDESSAEAVRDLDGLYVIGTNRHDSRRIDMQLRGRAGRQGDPGSTRFFVSLEDPLIETYRAEELTGRADVLKPHAGGLVRNRKVHREIERAQEAVEWLHVETRRRLDRSTRTIESQRQLVHGWRQDVLLGQSSTWLARTHPDVHERLLGLLGDELLAGALRDVTLFEIDRAWADHLARVRDTRAEDVPDRRRPVSIGTGPEAEAFEALLDGIRASIVRRLDPLADFTDVEALHEQLVRPAARWTYLEHEIPMRSDRYRQIEVFQSMFRDAFR